MPYTYIRTMDKFNRSILGGRIYGEGAYIWQKKHSNLQSVKISTFFSSFRYKARISAYFASCKLDNNKNTRMRNINDKVNNKDTVDVVLVSLLLTLNTFHFLLQCFYCWLWSVNCQLGLLLVVLTHRACWNQFRQSFLLWRNWVNKLH